MFETTSSNNSKLYANQRLEVLYNEPNIDNVIKSSRLMWASHIVRMDENELPKRRVWTNPEFSEDVADRNQDGLTG